MSLPLGGLVLLIVLATKFLAGEVAAQPARVDCGHEASTPEINFCFEQELEREDAALNRAYQAAMKETQHNDFMSAADRKNWANALRDAQRKWIAFRDADCRDLTGYEWFGGTGASGAALICLIDKTKARTKELTERYDAR